MRNDRKRDRRIDGRKDCSEVGPRKVYRIRMVGRKDKEFESSWELLMQSVAVIFILGGLCPIMANPCRSCFKLSCSHVSSHCALWPLHVFGELLRLHGVPQWGDGGGGERGAGTM